MNSNESLQTHDMAATVGGHRFKTIEDGVMLDIAAPDPPNFRLFFP
ncbi:MAG: hypothetical protein ONB46_24855 [candidate division KSB1 bacterium]|nr:hypothetical protein [candidate division KSB1 bacterium]MDZ7369144.1 hypothetical protein [candidate division KSB1 bacterium]MDZ7407093.1 hypothetical protein [candidate division KSB1 bacterium]